MPNADERLRFGAVSLLPETATAGLSYRIEASSDGTNWGNAEAVITEVQSRLQDGSLGLVSAYRNREASIYLKVTASTWDGLTAGEAALVAETQRDGYNTLLWTPSEAFAVPTVFDVVWSDMPARFNDYAETQKKRYFTLVLSCLPFPRSATEVVATAPAAGGTTTASVDECTSLTGWSGSPVTPILNSGVISVNVTSRIVDDGTDASTTKWNTTGSSPSSGVTLGSLSGKVIADSPNATAATDTLTLRRVNVGGNESVWNVGSMKFVAVDVRMRSLGPNPEISGATYVLNGSVVTPVKVTALGSGFSPDYYRVWLPITTTTLSGVAVTIPGAPGGVQVMIEQILMSSLDPRATELSLTRTGSVPTSATPYIVIDMVGSTSRYSGFSDAEILLDGTVAPIVGTAPVPPAEAGGASGYVRYWVKATGATVNTITARMRWDGQKTFFDPIADGTQRHSAAIYVERIQRTDSPPGAGSTRRELIRNIPVAGTMRTQGRLMIEHESTALGEVLAYIYSDPGNTGYIPALRQFRTAGGTVTTDASLYSGAYDNINTAVVFDVPAAALPAGSYELMARIRRATAGTVVLAVTTSTRVGGIDLPGSVTFLATVNAATTWSIVDLGAIALPSTLLATPAGATIRITIEDLADTSVLLDQGWVFNQDIGTLQHIDCGTGTPVAGGPSRRLRLDPATVTNNGKDAVFRAHSSDWSDAFSPVDGIRSYFTPQFVPPSAKVFTACAALDAAVSLRHYPRWLHNAGKVGTA